MNIDERNCELCGKTIRRDEPRLTRESTRGWQTFVHEACDERQRYRLQSSERL